MRVLTLFNDYRSRGNGELAVVRATQSLLADHGVETHELVRTSKGLDRNLRGKLRGFATGLYSRAAYREVDRLLRSRRPDVVHAHNLYPLLSPSVLVACRRAGVPTVVSLHNYGLTCPTWSHFHDGEVCTRCVGGREWACVAQNCRDSLAESIAYASRAAFARKLGLFRRNVDRFIVCSHFAARHFATAGFDENRLSVVPNMAPDTEPTDPAGGAYVAFAGRLTEEKGIATLLAAARALPDVRFRVAGEGPLQGEASANAPDNTRLVGFVDPRRMDGFYRGARFLVVPSTWYEMCPRVVTEAMAFGLPVVASRIGALPELVEDGVTGLLFEPGDAGELARKIAALDADAALRRELGAAGRRRALAELSGARYVERLLATYELAVGSRRAASAPASRAPSLAPPDARSVPR